MSGILRCHMQDAQFKTLKHVSLLFFSSLTVLPLTIHHHSPPIPSLPPLPPAYSSPMQAIALYASLILSAHFYAQFCVSSKRIRSQAENSAGIQKPEVLIHHSLRAGKVTACIFSLIVILFGGAFTSCLHLINKNETQNE